MSPPCAMLVMKFATVTRRVASLEREKDVSTQVESEVAKGGCAGFEV